MAHKTALLALCLGAGAWAGAANAQPEHVSGLPSGSLLDAGLSGDGRWMAWATDGPPELFIKDLDGSSPPVSLDLRTNTGDNNLDLPNDVFPDLSDDGSVIALAADGPEGSRNPEMLLVVDNNGDERLRVDAYDVYYNANDFDIGIIEEEVFIDGSGEYVVFSTDAERLIATHSSTFADTITNHSGVQLAYRVNVTTGNLDVVSAPATGALNDDATALAVSDGGRYVLFSSEATNLPGATGNNQLYRRDMNSSTVELVSLAAGANAPALYEVNTCSGGCRNVSISADGTQVLYSGVESISAPSVEATWRWTEGSGAEAIGRLAVFDDQLMSGDGDWMTAAGEPFTRLELDTGTTDTLNAAMSANRISDDGTLVLFHSSSLTPPQGEFGQYWVQRHAAPPPAQLEIRFTDAITMTDSVRTQSSVVIRFTDAITVSDTSSTSPSPRIILADAITVDEQVTVTLGTPPTPVPTPTIDLDYQPPLMPGSPIGVHGANFEPLSLVQLWLESTPMLITTQTANAAGQVTISTQIPANFPAGNHSVVLIGADANGVSTRAVAPITVQAAPPVPVGPAVPVPGPGGLALWLLGMLVAGAGVWRVNALRQWRVDR